MSSIRPWALVALAAFVASAAFAQDADSGHESSERPGSGLLIEVNAFGVSSLVGVNALAAAGGTTPFTFSPSVAAGFTFGDNAILADIGLLAYGPGTNVGVALDPTFRHYMKPLHANHLSPFVEGGLMFGIVSPANGDANLTLGLQVGAGAEYLFAKNIALVVDVLAQYEHTTLHNGGGGLSQNIDSIGLAGNVGVTVHF
jgi:hypothetical protein